MEDPDRPGAGRKTTDSPAPPSVPRRAACACSAPPFMVLTKVDASPERMPNSCYLQTSAAAAVRRVFHTESAVSLGDRLTTTANCFVAGHARSSASTFKVIG